MGCQYEKCSPAKDTETVQLLHYLENGDCHEL